MDHPSGSAPLAALQSTRRPDDQSLNRAASEPVKLDMLMSQQQQNGRDTPSTSSHLPDFDWEDFEARYERALEDADDHEREILKEAESLSKYFRAWASAASVQDNERAVKRLQTRQRFVNISEEKMAQKQQHCTCLIQSSLFKNKWLIKEDLTAFHEAHFSQNAISHFTGTFMSPGSEAAASYDVEECDLEDDGLGYYDDGVKRTLTDEQIEIFRHSELQRLRKAEEKKTVTSTESLILDDGELSESHDAKSRSTFTGQLGPKRKKRKTNKPPREPKPDLRKRTWDVVEAGLDTLDYD
ncbi:hypothetical protein NLU13_8056 [Sarocladium strictum]|uniref:Uncharacterized protein n=1 Tax=Sarocladium strictum TaxID=5046 RepID=A0AA39GD83_SARSR|nr:hypothetical protein NLU13_8056 [Sarocladium strictum]